MLHQPAEQFQPAKPAHFDVETYVREMRAAGAVLIPERGPRGNAALDGTYAILVDIANNEAVATVAERHAPLIEANKRNALGGVCDFLFMEQATQRAAAAIGSDFVAAVRLLNDLDAKAKPAFERESETMKLYDELRPDPPKEVRWHPFQSLYADHQDMFTSSGKRISIFSAEGIEQLRVNPRSMEMSPTEEGVEPFRIGDDFEPRTDIEREWKIRRTAEIRAKADVVIAAYDAWCRECDRVRIDCGFQAAEVEAQINSENYYGALNYIMSMPIRTHIDAAIKAKIALQREKSEVENVLDEIAEFLVRHPPRSAAPASAKHGAGGDKRLIELCKRARVRLEKDRASIDHVCDLTAKFEQLEPERPTYTSAGYTSTETQSAAEMREKLPAIRECNSKTIVDGYRARIAKVAVYERERDRLRREIGLTQAEKAHRRTWHLAGEIVGDIAELPATTAIGLAHKGAILSAWKAAGNELVDEGVALAFSIAEDARMLGTGGQVTSRHLRQRQPSAQAH